MPSRKKTWRTGRERVTVDAALAIQRENVMLRLTRLRTEIGHPERQGEPLPQDQAAARAGVTVRQWQRWETGVSIPYARNLSAVADAFAFDVAEFYDGPAGQQPAGTPSPFPEPNGIAGRLDQIEQRVTDQLAEHAANVEKMLERQDALLEQIKRNVKAERAARREAQAQVKELREILAALAVAIPALTAESPRTESTPGTSAR